eukprot:1152695-Pelagomonas_calceolata.AAC.2
MSHNCLDAHTLESPSAKQQKEAHNREGHSSILTKLRSGSHTIIVIMMPVTVQAPCATPYSLNAQE